MRAVKPVAHEFSSGDAFRLGDLRLVMRENVIDAAAVDIDLIFPHHENEIAQSESISGKPFSRFWLHAEHLHIESQKMSKSLGNFYTLPNLLEKGYTGREIRYALMRVHYRAPLNFTWDGMNEARESLARIDDWLVRLRETAAGKIDKRKIDMQPGQEFEEALDDDLNISAALGFLFETIRETNRALDRNELGAASANAWLNWWERVNSVLVLEEEIAPLPPGIAKLVEARAQARLAKDWRKSDELRDELSVRGWEARDTKDGQKITRRAGG